MKKIMILGAGIYQVPLIKKAKELGLYTIVCSIKGEYPGFAYADKIYYVNTTDREQILELAKAEQIDGICTTGTDVAVITIGYVCDKLGLSGVSFESAQIATNKAVMKQCFLNNQVSTAAFYKVDSKEMALDAFDKLRKPVVMKIVDKSGSRGIIRVVEREQVETIFEEELKRTDLPYIVIEEFVDGHEVGIDALVQNGEVKLLLSHDKLMYQSGSTTIPVGHILPMEMDENIMLSLDETAKKAIKAMGLNNCAVNMDVFVTATGEVFVIEVGGRAGATGIPEVMGTYSGYNYYEQILKIALGENVEIGELKRVPCASILFRAPNAGILNNVSLPQMEKVEYGIDFAIGHRVSEMQDGTDRIGQAVVWADEIKELKEKIDKVLQETVIEVN